MISMRTFSASAAVLVITGMMSQAVHAHGIPLDISADSQLRLFNPLLVTYDHHESGLALAPPANPTAVRGAAGFYPTAGVIPAGTALSVDATGSPQHPLAVLYWNPSNGLGASPKPLTLQRNAATVGGISYPGFNVAVQPTDTFASLGTLPHFNGTQGDHRAMNVSLPMDAPQGLYVIGFQVSAPGFTRSDTFWAVGNYGLTESEAEAGLGAIAAAVPEPSCGLLMLAGLSMFAWTRRTRG